MEAKTSELIGPALDWVVAKILSETAPFHGPTPLIAAMRCYVASNLGEEVEIPEEVLK